jgi:5-methylcytosine-specific restriction protein B
MSFPWTPNGSLTRHFMLADIPSAIAALPQPATIAQAQAALDGLGGQHGGLAVRLFGTGDATPSPASVIHEDALVTACRAGDPSATHLVWAALVMADQRIATAVENFLTTAEGKLDATHFARDPLAVFLAAGVAPDDGTIKMATNILRWMETVKIVVPTRAGPTIVGIDQMLQTSHSALPLANLVRDRFEQHMIHPAPHADPVDLALGVGANRWINLTAEEFRNSARPGLEAADTHRVGEVPPGLKELHAELYRKGQVILQGPPGTGKTFLARQFVDWFTDGSASATSISAITSQLPSHERTPRHVAEFALVNGIVGVWDIVQFHPSMSYDDFVRSLRAEPVVGGVTFVPTHRTFGFLCEVGRHLRELGAATEVLLVVDEINRADISKVLGELIYGLEYRGEPITTPYVVDGRAALTVPENLFLIGTMNTADRSIALIDYALRRRFVYLDVRPSREAIEGHAPFSANGKAASLRLFDAVATLFAEGPELQAIRPGHSYFLAGTTTGTPEAEADSIARRMAYEVIPLLFEYEAEGRFPTGSVVRLFADLGLTTSVSSGYVVQSELVAELVGRITAGTLSTPIATVTPTTEVAEPPPAT